MMRNVIRIVIVAAASAAIGASDASAHEITVETIIRDFRESHADFQGTIANDRNYVADLLGADKKPVYIGGAGTATTSGAANYNQWYNDVSGVNKSTLFNLTFSNGGSSPGGTYSFSDSTFFPIDHQLFGNEGHTHNYHFTMEMHTRFVYKPGLTLNALADDDLLIFINSRKAVDLGGIHSAQNAHVNLNSLSLNPGQTYDFDLFFAERHTTQSTLEFCSNLKFVPEPGTMLLMASGAVAALLRRRRR